MGYKKRKCQGKKREDRDYENERKRLREEKEGE